MKEVIEIVGEEVKRWEFEDGIVFIYREPDTREIVKYNDSIKFSRRGKNFTTQSAESQIVLADTILIDVEGLGYRDPKKKVFALTCKTIPEEIAHLKVDGMAPRSWKDLIPPRRKTRFISELMAGTEELEKNE